jgi:hypothetical protein
VEEWDPGTNDFVLRCNSLVFDENDIRMKKKIQIDPPSKYHPTVSPKLDRCILQMIDLKPENRYQSVWDVISEIETLPDSY